MYLKLAIKETFFGVYSLNIFKFNVTPSKFYQPYAIFIPAIIDLIEIA